MEKKLSQGHIILLMSQSFNRYFIKKLPEQIKKVIKLLETSETTFVNSLKRFIKGKINYLYNDGQIKIILKLEINLANLIADHEEIKIQTQSSQQQLIVRERIEKSQKITKNNSKSVLFTIGNIINDSVKSLNLQLLNNLMDSKLTKIEIDLKIISNQINRVYKEINNIMEIVNCQELYTDEDIEIIIKNLKMIIDIFERPLISEAAYEINENQILEISLCGVTYMFEVKELLIQETEIISKISCIELIKIKIIGSDLILIEKYKKLKRFLIDLLRDIKYFKREFQKNYNN